MFFPERCATENLGLRLGSVILLSGSGGLLGRPLTAVGIGAAVCGSLLATDTEFDVRNLTKFLGATAV